MVIGMDANGGLERLGRIIDWRIQNIPCEYQRTAEDTQEIGRGSGEKAGFLEAVGTLGISSD
jgi:hypothetical protein